MLDCLGKEVELGDQVAFIQQNQSSGLATGTVIGLTKSGNPQVRIETIGEYMRYRVGDVRAVTYPNRIVRL